MDLAPVQQSMLDDYLAAFDPLIGDKWTERTFRGTVQGIIGAESLVGSRIAAFPPHLVTGGHNGEQRVRRMARGESTKRSEMDAEHLTERLRKRGLEQLRDEEEVWAIVDPSELRKPYAKEMPALMRVRKTGSEKGMVPGYRTLNVLGVGREGRRGARYHQLFSSQAEGFESESTEIQRALSMVGESLTSKKVTYLMDSQKDVLGWEDVQLMDLEAIRTLVALGWVAAGFLYELGVTLEWPEVQLLARLGGWIPKPNRPPGKTILSKGLQQLLDHLATEAILADEIRRNGALPPRIAAFLGPNWQPAS